MSDEENPYDDNDLTEPLNKALEIEMTTTADHDKKMQEYVDSNTETKTILKIPITLSSEKMLITAVIVQVSLVVVLQIMVGFVQVKSNAETRKEWVYTTLQVITVCTSILGFLYSSFKYSDKYAMKVLYLASIYPLFFCLDKMYRQFAMGYTECWWITIFSSLAGLISVTCFVMLNYTYSEVVSRQNQKVWNRIENGALETVRVIFKYRQKFKAVIWLHMCAVILQYINMQFMVTTGKASYVESTRVFLFSAVHLLFNVSLIFLIYFGSIRSYFDDLNQKKGTIYAYIIIDFTTVFIIMPIRLYLHWKYFTSRDGFSKLEFFFTYAFDIFTVILGIFFANKCMNDINHKIVWLDKKTIPTPPETPGPIVDPSQIKTVEVPVDDQPWDDDDQPWDDDDNDVQDSDNDDNSQNPEFSDKSESV